MAGRRGTAFHAWVEQHYADAGLVDVLELPGSADDSLADTDLSTMQEHFLASEWADRVPLEVELSLETVLGEHAVRGRVDAVFDAYRVTGRRSPSRIGTGAGRAD